MSPAARAWPADRSGTAESEYVRRTINVKIILRRTIKIPAAVAIMTHLQGNSMKSRAAEERRRSVEPIGSDIYLVELFSLTSWACGQKARRCAFALTRE